MGREIRRVPPNWKHPTEERPNYRTGQMETVYRPLYSRSEEQALADWLADFERIKAGDLTEIEQKCYPRGLLDWLLDDHPPREGTHRTYSDEEATWFQLYETVSEGTPVTPPFATKEELVEYLVQHGDFWDQKRAPRGTKVGWSRKAAEQMVRDGWAPTLAFIDGQRLEPRDGIPPVKKLEARGAGE